MHNSEKSLEPFTTKEKSYILEVDVEYPNKLHEKHNDLPFVLESIKIEKVEKLEKNVVHIRFPYQALREGSVLNKVHRVHSFTQSDWLKFYIDIQERFFKKEDDVLFIILPDEFKS